MRKNVVLMTNNRFLYQSVGGRYINGSSMDVLVCVRDAIHLGSLLLTHPLCGNLRPYQQPFRSILIEHAPGNLVDLDSLSMIEEAVAVYRSCAERLLLPEALHPETREDYAFVDCELMRESLEQYRLLPKARPFVMSAGFERNS